MDVTHACRCCLRCPPDKDLTTPYTHLGKTEIYGHIIKECFDIHLVVGGSGSCGICSMCVGRLRDASEFKLQVQRSQAELQARTQGASQVKGEEPPVKPEMLEEDLTPDEILHDMLRFNMAAGDAASDGGDPLSAEGRAVKSEVSDAASDEDCVSGEYCHTTILLHIVRYEPRYIIHT
ncbi:uncharacterized protein LOC134658243 [Cydia amplana]|uniref:uncharacterized protein LOC134658243 n=1 Tax=Cydia amplana TaxID=1869771 RepID=UPI002FE68E85